MKSYKLYCWLCLVNLFISAFTFGGGYVVVPMIRKYFVEGKQLFTEDELIEMAAIAQSSPGAIAMNLCVLAGKRTAGIPGVIVSCLSSLLPPLIILGFISLWYVAFSTNPIIIAVLKGMQACVAALIVDLIIDMYRVILKERSHLLTALVPVSFLCSFFLQMNVMLILLGSCGLCILFLCWNRRKVSSC